MDRMLAERPGNVVVMSGRNRGKIESIRRSVDAGLHVLADKPWIILSKDLPALEQTLDNMERKGVVAYDIMTERYEVTSILLKELLHDSAIFGNILPGTESEPGVSMESVHHIMKVVAGAPNLRPAWFFDTQQQGEGLSDVGTHLVDLVQWTLFPDRAPDYRSEIHIDGAERWPTMIAKPDFQRVTGEPAFPAYLAEHVAGDRLEYYCNNRVRYTVRGIHTTLDVLWNWEAPPGASDTYLARFRGTRARLEIRQGHAENYRPELYVVPNNGAGKPAFSAALARRLRALESQWPGVASEDVGNAIRILIPDRYRVGHEAHFAQVTRQFFAYLRDPKSLPAWEKPAMLAKYFVSTRGVELGRTRKAP